MGERRICILPGPNPLAEQASQEISRIAIAAIGARGVANLALSGGITPATTYRLVADLLRELAPLLHIFQVDERYVPSDHPLSNLRMLRETLLAPLNLPPTNVHSIPTEAASPEQAAEVYERDIVSHFSLPPGQFPAFDLVVLGLGADGHTASLFPGSSALTEHQRLAVSTFLPEQQMWRITLTLPCINAARNAMFLVSGQEKAPAVRRVLRGDRSLPAALVSPSSGSLSWILDEAAVGLGG